MFVAVARNRLLMSINLQKFLKIKLKCLLAKKSKGRGGFV